MSLEGSGKKTIVNLRKKGFSDQDNIFYSLNQCDKITELDLGENNLTMLPNDLSMFQNLVYLDISNNPLENYQDIGKALGTLPKLCELKIDLFSQDNAHCILSQLPQLQYLNDNATKEDQKPLDVEDKELDFSSLKNEIPNFNSILKRLEKKLKGSKETIDFFYSEFEKILKSQIDIINSLDESVSNFLYAATALQSKVEIYSYLQNKAINMLSGQVDYEIIGIIKDINGFIKANEISTIDLLKKITPKFEEHAHNENSMKEDLNNKNKALNGKIMQLQKDLENKDVYLHELSEQNGLLLSQIQEMKNSIAKANEMNQQQLRKKSEHLKNTNYEANSQVVESLNNKVDDKVNIASRQLNMKSQNRNNQSANSLSTSYVASQQESHVYSSVNTNNNNNNNNNAYNPTAKKSPSNVRIGPISGRVLSKKMLLETINEIYQSKIAYDKKCQESKLPNETMEQHMYTYLNHKYGLKNIIIEWATGIINAIRLYSLEDSEVCLFGKILRNEIEEKSLAIFDKVKRTINDFLLYYLQNQYSYKNKGDIQQLLSKLKTGFLSEEEWINIIEYIFDDPNEKKNLVDRIYAFIQRGESRTWNTSNRQGKPITKEEQQMLEQAKQSSEILYNDFIQLVLDFQIRLRDRYLKPFVQMFRNVDNDMNGIINDEEFFSLVSMFDIYSDSEINQSFEMLLNSIDPNHNKQITFSELVTALSGEYVFIPDNSINNEQMMKISILDKIAMNNLNSNQ